MRLRQACQLPSLLFWFAAACSTDDGTSNPTATNSASGPGGEMPRTTTSGSDPSPTNTPTNSAPSPGTVQPVMPEPSGRGGNGPTPNNTSGNAGNPPVSPVSPTPSMTGPDAVDSSDASVSSSSPVPSTTGSDTPVNTGGTGGTPNPVGGAGGEGGNGGTPDEPDPPFSSICEPGATYGNPLEGMGQVVEIGPPTQGPMTYFAFIEGPIWVSSRERLFFSDNASSPTEVIWQLVPPSTTPELFMPESGSNGLAVDGDDQLLLADQRNQRVVRVDSTTATVIDTLVPSGNYRPNDLQMRSDGNLYFTDLNSPGRGFYRMAPDGELTGPVQDLDSPNGVVLSLDETILYVGDMNPKEIHAYPLSAEGAIDTASGTLFATTQGSTLDGMAVDCAGNVYGSTGNGVEVFSPTGEPIGTVPTGESSNATFGGTDHKTLYVTSRSLLKAVTLAVPGPPN